MSRVISLQGDEKTGKTSFGLTCPTPMVYMEFDIGGYDRAIPRFRSIEKQITRIQFPQPQQAMLTRVGGTLKVTEAKRLVGVKELWYKFLESFISALDNKQCKTIVMDTATSLRQICNRSYLQEVQESQIMKAGGYNKFNGKLRERLQQIEYVEPNGRYRAILSAARNYNKDLILIHYERDQYQDRVVGDEVKSVVTGKKELDGFAETPKLADLMLRMDVVMVPVANSKPVRKMPTPQATIISRVPMESFGYVLNEPTYDCLIQTIELLSGEA